MDHLQCQPGTSAAQFKTLSGEDEVRERQCGCGRTGRGPARDPWRRRGGRKIVFPPEAIILPTHASVDEGVAVKATRMLYVVALLALCFGLGCSSNPGAPASSIENPNAAS